MSFMLTFVTVALVAIALGFLTQGLKHYNQRRYQKNTECLCILHFGNIAVVRSLEINPRKLTSQAALSIGLNHFTPRRLRPNFLSIKPLVSAAGNHQIFMTSRFDDMTIFKHQNAVSLFDRT